jgi:hypothetical protein
MVLRFAMCVQAVRIIPCVLVAMFWTSLSVIAGQSPQSPLRACCRTRSHSALLRDVALLQRRGTAGHEKPKTEKTEAEKQSEKEGREKTLKGTKTSIDRIMEQNARPLGITPMRLITWQKSGAGYTAKITANYAHSTEFVPSWSGDFTGLSDYITPGELTVYTGDIPDNQQWRSWLSTHKHQHVFLSRSSPLYDAIRNLNAGDSARAVEELGRRYALAGKPLKQGSSIIFNAFPREQSLLRSKRERVRMRIAGSKSDWIAVNKDLGSRLKPGFPMVTANKQDLVEELHHGSRDVVLLMAHSESRTIHLPGAKGLSISFDELDRLRRDVPPDRVVVLLACDAGGVNASGQSLAEIIIKNGLAKTVLAPAGTIYAESVPGIINDLTSGVSLRDSLPTLRVIALLLGANIEVAD